MEGCFTGGGAGWRLGDPWGDSLDSSELTCSIVERLLAKALARGASSITRSCPSWLLKFLIFDSMSLPLCWDSTLAFLLAMAAIKSEEPSVTSGIGFGDFPGETSPELCLLSDFVLAFMAISKAVISEDRR